MIAANSEPFRPRVSFSWINESLYVFQRDWGVWVSSLLIFIVIIYAISFAIGMVVGSFFGETVVASGGFRSRMFWNMEGVVYLVSLIIQLPISGFFYGGLYKMANKAVRGLPLEFSDVFSGADRTLQFMVYCFIYGALSALGLIGCIIGTFIVTALLYPGLALIADGVDFNTALKKSFDAVKHDWLNASALVFVTWLLFAFSSLCFIALLVTGPMIIIMASLAYRDMIGMPLGDAPVQVSVPTGAWPPAPTTLQQPTSSETSANVVWPAPTTTVEEEPTGSVVPELPEEEPQEHLPEPPEKVDE